MMLASVCLAGLFFLSCTSDDAPKTSETTLPTTASSADEAVSSAEIFPGTPQLVIANSPGSVSTTGEQRIMTALVGGENNSFLGSPDRSVTVGYKPVDGESDGDSVEGEWLTTNASELGLYVSRFSFDEPGIWQITVSDGSRELASSLFEIVEESAVPQPGDFAPPSVTPTATTPDEITQISTDQDPDEALYDLSIKDAVSNGKPTLIVFATPAFCQTALCGPTLEFVRGAAAGQSDLDVVHVEPFDLTLARAGTLDPVEAMFDYGLATEPWVFIVDAEGKVTHSFEGIIGQPELEEALAS